MSDAGDLMRSLDTIREAATQVLHAHGSAQSQEAFCLVIHGELPTIAEDYNLAANDTLRLKIATSIEAMLRKLATDRIVSAEDRARLVVSYARSLRADIDKLMPILRG